MRHLFIVLFMIVLAANVSFSQKNINTQTKAPAHPMILMKTALGDITIELWPEIAPKTVENFIGLATGTKEWKDPITRTMIKRPFYDGLTFHRVINDFMIQGGCPNGDGTGGPGYSFEDECYEKGAALTGTIPDEQTAVRVYQEMLVPYLRTAQPPDSEVSAIVQQCQQQRSGKPLLAKTMEWFVQKTGAKEPLSNYGKLRAKVEYGTICMANSGPNTNGSQFFIVTKKAGCDWLDGKHTVFGKVVKGLEIVHAIEAKEKDPTKVKIVSVTLEK